MEDKPVKETNNLTRGLILGLGIALAVVTVFSFGMFVGEQKARFSYLWGRNYHGPLGGPPIGMGRPKGFFGGHGAAGVVIDKKKDSLVVRGPDNAEKTVLIDKNTYLIKGRQKVGLKEINNGDQVVVMGFPDSKGRIKARLIRIFDPGSWKEPMWRRDNSRPLPPSLL